MNVERSRVRRSKCRTDIFNKLFNYLDVIEMILKLAYSNSVQSKLKADKDKPKESNLPVEVEIKTEVSIWRPWN